MITILKTLKGKFTATALVTLLLVMVAWYSTFVSFNAVEKSMGSGTDSLSFLELYLGINKSKDNIRNDIVRSMAVFEVKDESKKFLPLVEQHTKELEKYLEDTQRHPQITPEAKKTLEANKLLFQEYAAKALQIVKKTTDPSTDPNAINVIYENFDRIAIELNKEQESIDKYFQVKMKDLTTEFKRITNEDNKRAKVTNSLIFFIIIITIAVLFFYIYNNFNGKLARLEKVIKDINKQNYDARSDLKEDDELGKLGGALNKMLDERMTQLTSAEAENEDLNTCIIELLQVLNLLTGKDLTARAFVKENIIGTLSSSVNMLADETQKALKQTTDIALLVKEATEVTAQQSIVLNELSGQETEIVSKISESFGKSMAEAIHMGKLATDSTDAAKLADKTTTQALNTVKQTVLSMDNIRVTVSEAESKIKRLGERSQEIGLIVNLINSISERTHVLALNASMQAAMAGDAGRGFAVVAEEVQKLAENTRNATSQIGQLVMNIQVETVDTINIVNKTIEHVVTGSKLAAESGIQMEETQSKTAVLIDLVRDIVVFIENQSKLTSELQRHSEAIAKNSSETAEKSKDQLMQTRTLLQFSKQLTDLVGKFKIN